MAIVFEGPLFGIVGFHGNASSSLNEELKTMENSYGTVSGLDLNPFFLRPLYQTRL